jgi:O-antigen/teichoic acid export membrane protein
LFFAFLIIPPITYTIAETTGLGYNLYNKTYWLPMIYVISAFANVIGAVILVPIFGITGVAISSALSSILSLFFRTYIGERYYKIVKHYRYIISSLVLVIAASIFSFFLNEIIIWREIAILFLIVLSLLIYFKEIKITIKVIILLIFGRKTNLN